VQRSELGAECWLVPEGRRESAARTRILKVGLRLFSRQGFHGTSLRDIAAELQLQPSALYAQFRSKEHVLPELLRLGHHAHRPTAPDRRGHRPTAARRPTSCMAAMSGSGASYTATPRASHSGVTSSSRGCR
jgi:hypothetical protein